MDFWKDKKVFLTGHTGFKGSWLAFWLSSLGAAVCGYALDPEDSPNLFTVLDIESRVDSVIADVRDLNRVQSELERFEPDVVFHLAAQSLVRRSYRLPVETYETNLMGTVNVLEAIRSAESVKAAVIITTDKVYENEERPEPYREDEPLGGFDPYSSSKACAEIASSAYRRSFFSDSECHVATARAGNVIGGGDWSEDRLVPDIFRSLLDGENLFIRNPDSVRPWQHVLEPLYGYLTLAKGLFEGNRSFAGAWNFGPSLQDSRTVAEVLDIVTANWPTEVGFTMPEQPQPHEAGFLALDSSKARKTLDWHPQLDLEKALELTCEWYDAFGNEKDMSEVTARQIEFYTNKQSS
ncbi:MAG: CDP-glucose 4,6-dehydratase [Pyrinomonadaceae bacterium]|nr:CDP-glucose 4,6-dehydratase [Pyrinomonadaceae bacterium]